MKRNSMQGKQKTNLVFMTRFYWRLIVQPTITPMRTPSMQEETTKMTASQKQSSLIRILVKPIALNNPTSFFCSQRLAAIDAQREKKQRNIVMLMIEQKRVLRRVVILLFNKLLVVVVVKDANYVAYVSSFTSSSIVTTSLGSFILINSQLYFNMSISVQACYKRTGKELTIQQSFDPKSFLNQNLGKTSYVQSGLELQYLSGLQQPQSYLKRMKDVQSLGGALS